MDEALNRLSSMVTRLSIAIIAAAFIMGLPVVATICEPPGWDVLGPVWFFSGVAVIVALIGRLAVADRKSPRR